MSEDYRGYLKIAPNAELDVKTKVFEILGLKSKDDTHHVAYSMNKLAEAVAKLSDAVADLDIRVSMLEEAVEEIKSELECNGECNDG